MHKYGKWDAAAAKNVARRICACIAKAETGRGGGQPLPASESITLTGEGVFDTKEFGLWKTPPPAVLSELVDAMGTTIKEQVAKSDEQLTINSKTEKPWHGAVSRLEYTEQTFGSVTLGLMGPCLVSVVRDVPRFGAQAWPLPTVGSFTLPATSDLFVVSISAKAILDQGIALSDVKGLLGTSTGDKLLTDAAHVVYLPKGSAYYTPWGYVNVPIYYTAANRSDKTMPQWTHAVHVPMMDLDLAQAIDPEVLTAANSMIHSHLLAKTGQLWAARKEAWEKFFAAAGAR